MFETNGQASIFLATVYSGLMVGLLYDIMGLIRRALGGRWTITWLFDLLFWIIAAGALTLSIALSGGDGLRAYMLLGFLCGALLYAIGIHQAIVSVARKIAKSYRRMRWRAKKKRARLLAQEG